MSDALPDLYITPTLLLACHEGRVVEGHEDTDTWQTDIGYEPRKVTQRIQEFKRHGLVELDEAGVFWGLTDAGRKAMGWTS